jgi:hypothetical protein
VQPIYLSDFGTEGADLKGIYYLRNVVDADAIVAAIAEAKGHTNKVKEHGQCAFTAKWHSIYHCIMFRIQTPEQSHFGVLQSNIRSCNQAAQP